MKPVNWPNKKFKTLLFDPPWTFEVFSDKGKERSAEKHYNVMTKEDIQNLPVQDIADEDCVLFLWVTFPNLIEGLELIKKWGFTYKTVAFTWVKRNKGLDGYFMALGYWTRANAEICLLATKGKPKRKSKSVRQLIVSPVREHSRKPDEVHDRIEQLVDGPYFEGFARSKREGWTVWGNESDKFKRKKKNAP